MKLPGWIKKWVHRAMRVPLLTWLRIASLLTIVALALMVWSLFDPTLVPIIIGMSLAQVFGTVSFGIYLVVVLRDITRIRRERRSSQELPRL